ncbi:MAG TPA: type I DNA topoisomerase [Armatimonadota bacterium]|nr:type I DNA topoisomerase [Armatimonadota bacterium]
MGKSLIIVESPAKTRTLRGFVGPGYEIAASMGHVRDLPPKRLGVDVEHDFAPEYEPLADRKAALAELRKQVKAAAAVYLASDPDREGEAIAWHLAQALKLKEPRRIEFNEITKRAVQHALEHPRDIDMRRVDAQQARRVLDRLVGYKLSPLLWRKLRRNARSAGRVQSVTVKLVCDREREIEAFQPQEHWDIFADLTPGGDDQAFRAKLVAVAGEKAKVGDGERALSIAEDARKQSYEVARIKRADRSLRPAPPFITSTLQQEASARLGMAPRRTMVVAQQLYEGIELGAEGSVGLITYMRTDSTRVAQDAQAEAREYITSSFGAGYVPERPRQFAARKGAQEAHEAIRPTYVAHSPDAVAQYLDRDQLRLYRLIWSRFVASQMADAVLDVMVVDAAGGPYLFRVTGQAVRFAGFMRVYSPLKAQGEEGAEMKLPPLQDGQALTLLNLDMTQKFTQPPPRYTEASLVRVLESKGIGRPSTYAPILGTIRERGYVYLDDEKPKHLRPTDLGLVVTDQLAEHFPRIMNVQFTATVEEQLDRVEQGENDWVQLLREFYGPFAESLARAEENMGAAPVPPAPEVAPTPEATPTLAAPEVAGAPAQPAPETEPPLPFITRKGTVTEDSLGKCATVVDASDLSLLKVGNERGTEYPVGRKAVRRIVSSLKPAPPPPSLAQEASPEVTPRPAAPLEPVQAAPTAARSARMPARETLEKCPQCGKALVVRVGKRGPFMACSGYPECRYTAPVGDDGASPALSQPTDEVCAECGKPMLVRTGRRGPFLGCSGYPECKHTGPLAKEGATGTPDDEGPQAEQARAAQKQCPECGKPMTVRHSRRGAFLGCSGYPTCRHTEPLAAGDRQRPQREPPRPTGETCDQCGKPMVVRGGRRGGFVGCSGYPKCRNTRPIPTSAAGESGPEPAGSAVDDS